MNGAMEPLDDTVDHVRGGGAGRLIVRCGEYECPYSRQAFREVERVESQLGGQVRFAFIEGVMHRGPCDAASLLQGVTAS